MIRTPELIDLLATDLPPVRRLRAPLVRAAGWAFVAISVLVLLCIGQGLRADLHARFGEASFLITVGAALLTAFSAAVAAFNLAVPGRSRAWLLLPLPPLLVWLGSVGRQCLTRWITYDGGNMGMGETARCFATLVLSSLPLWLLMLLMLRRGRPVAHFFPMMMGGLAVAAAASTAMDLLHQLDTSAMLLAWNFGVGAVIVGPSVLASRLALNTKPLLRS